MLFLSSPFLNERPCPPNGYCRYSHTPPPRVASNLAPKLCFFHPFLGGIWHIYKQNIPLHRYIQCICYVRVHACMASTARGERIHFSGPESCFASIFPEQRQRGIYSIRCRQQRQSGGQLLFLRQPGSV